MIRRLAQLTEVVLICVLTTCILSSAQDESEEFLEKQALRYEEKLDVAVRELKEVNRKIGAEKEPLLTELTRLRILVSKNRTTVDGHVLSKKEIEQALEIAKSDVQERETHLDYANSLIGDYAGNFEQRLNASEDQRYHDELTRLRMAHERIGGMQSKEALDNRFQILDLAVGRLERLLGGDSFHGQAVDSSGQLIEGDFILYGPTGLFVSSDRELTGGAKFATNMLNPVVVPSRHYDAAELGKVLDSGKGLVSLDASLGRAMGIETARWSLADHVRKGGYVGYAILVFAALSLLACLVKVRDFMSIRTSGGEAFADILVLMKEGQVSAAISRAGQASYPFNRILGAALSNHDEEDEIMEEVVVGEIQKVKIRLDRLLPFLAITAAASPLMGLLGTVVGMIKTFALITVFGSGEAKSLSSGISEALITTEFGLLVAIPTLLLHGAFVRMSKERIGALEDFASDFVVGLKKMRRKDSSD